MLPLDSKKSFDTIRKLFHPANSITIAAPFFGKGAYSQLGLTNSKANITVICDLNSGACNPFEMKHFLKPTITLLTCDTLHAKIYLTETGVAIGSANPSANGLGFEGNELQSQIEACVASTEGVIVNAWSDFVRDQILPHSRPLTKQNIDDSIDIWRERRNGRRRLESDSFLKKMRSDPE